jgi:orotidine-5'-phosphate decarboxylase
MPAADQAQATAEATIHQIAVKASTELNKLARALQQAGVEQETVSQVDEMANVANELASVGVGNTPAPPANPGSDPALSPQDDLGSAIQSFHNESVAAAQPA